MRSVYSTKGSVNVREVMTRSLTLPTRVTQKLAEHQREFICDGAGNWVKAPDSQKPNVENYNVELMYKVLFRKSF